MTSNNNLNVEKNKVEVSKNVPDLRFQGFIDDWELRKLKDVTERVRSNDGRMDLPTLTMSASSGWLDQKDRFSGDISGKEKKNYTLLKKGELSYNHGNSKLAKYGVVFSLTNYEEALVPRVYHSFKALENTSADFIEYMFSTKLPDRELGKLVSSGARMDGLLNINYDDFMNIHISIPNYEEQILMSAFFRKLDETIALHQRKLEKLKRLKQGYLQQLFPQNDEKVPIVRFANFEDELKQRKLGEISRMYQPLTITGNDLLPDGVPVFGANGFIGFFSEANHIDDQVTISARGEGTGTPSYVHGPVWITGNSMVVNVDDFDIDKYFLFANLTANSLKKYVTGGAQPQLTRDVLVKVPITLPNADEQEKIGSFFKQLDETITLHHSKLDKLNLLKQALLQKMFI
ncbi:restriction endonuclease subunit S [Lactococcus lactis]|uniref:restriction endonuclease subunit S n=4 Tax=Lactococcus lactis TaxID=1358 RepID=UPI002890D3CB|nr:restriction endonuclease subunit S [Lactococcus lactis]MDT2898270.1 restriction endonuclease subunit S [Lactococcus lactis]MDT2908447.1 restriction endonuclease subunit S [Lactococcus lactis]MDT2951580.1 restriction endonuclease subunit S [Lactococcus lactis]